MGKSVVVFGAEIEKPEAIGDAPLRDASVSKLCALLVKEFDAFEREDVPVDAEEQYRWVQDKITFMYR